MQRFRSISALAGLTIAIGASVIGGPVRAADDTVRIVDEIDPETFDRLTEPVREKAGEVIAQYSVAMQNADDGHLPDKTPFWGYDRDAFTRTAYESFDLLAEKHPDAFGGGAVDPLRAIAYIGVVGDNASALERAIKDLAPDIEYEFVSLPFTHAYKTRVESALTELALGSISGSSIAERWWVNLDPDQIRSDPTVLAANVTRAAELPESQVDQLAKAMTSALATGGYVVAGPVVLIPAQPEVKSHSLASGVFLDVGGYTHCTSGYAMKKISTGTTYSTTAAHCVDAGTIRRSGTILPAYASGSAMGEPNYLPDQDWAFLSVPSPVAPAIGKIYVSSNEIHSVDGPWRSTWTGDLRCKKGATTGKTCGYDDGTWCGYGTATFTAAGGDSGGPVFYPYGTVLAAGLLTGECRPTIDMPWKVVYTRIYNVEKAYGANAQYTVVPG